MPRIKSILLLACLLCYTSAQAIWLSPDPLLDKYPYISPYAYCNWNPVKYVDPDGRDEFEVNWNPEVNKVTIKQIKNENYDQFHIVDADGDRIASSNKYDYRTITKLRSGKWGKSNLSLFDVKGDDNAEDLFRFLGSNFTKEKGAPLEWSRVMVGTSNSGRNIIGTSMKENATGVGHYIMFNGYTIRGVDHNHPNGTGPSNPDINNALFYNLKFPRAILRVYANGKQLKEESPIIKKARNSLHELFTSNSYEYINYKVNHEKIVDFALDNIVGKLFSFMGDSCKKESIRFINDSICVYEASKIDTCQYVVKNNLIAIDVIKHKSCDTLAYSNGILFYSKVYKDNKTDKYEHIVKPFIDEARSCASKTDSINMIMNAYYSVYVPLNMYK